MASSGSTIGHKAQRESLEKLLVMGKLPSTILLSGPAGIGKKRVAEELARTIFCNSLLPSSKKLIYGGCGSCQNCHLFHSGNLPDYYLVDCLEKGSWDVDGIKELLFSLNLTSFSQRGRVIVFNDAEYLHTSSANALLKSLEEPRPNTWFIIVTSNPSKLPSTILSRSQAWFFNPLNHTESQQVLARMQSEIDGLPLSMDEMVLLSDGSPGSITSIKEHAAFWVDLKVALSAIHHGDSQQAIALSQTLAKERELLRDRLKLIRIYARHRMMEDPSDALWALLVTNAIAADRLLFERNLSAQNVLNMMFLNLVSGAEWSSFTALTNSDTLLERIVV